MKRAGWVGAILVAAIGAGCVSTTPSERFARELISPYQSSLVASRSSEELLIDQGVIEALRTLAAERGQVLRALLHVQQGVHPYLAFVIVESNTGTQGVATSMYWNDVLEKRVSELSPSDVLNLFGAMRDAAECSTGPVEKPLFGTVLVQWNSGVQTQRD